MKLATLVHERRRMNEDQAIALVRERRGPAAGRVLTNVFFEQGLRDGSLRASPEV